MRLSRVRDILGPNIVISQATRRFFPMFLLIFAMARAAKVYEIRSFDLIFLTEYVLIVV